VERRKLKNVCVVDRTDNRDLLNACALLITTYSTMAIEALIFEKPVIQLRFVNKKRLMNALARQGILCDEDVIPLATSGAALGVDYPEKLKEAITKISKDEEVRKLLIERGKVFLEKYGYVRDGKATERMIECIETMLEHTA
jgi:CDP-glycerol glycerophosphotransferase (TagB/SpsB family)